jgi:hypothetical protein
LEGVNSGENYGLTTLQFFLFLYFRHPGPANAVSAEPGSRIYAKTQSVLFFVFKRYIGKRLRLLTVALDTGSALAALVCPA